MKRDVLALVLVALLGLAMACGLWLSYQQQIAIIRALDGIGHQLDVREQERIGLMEARIVVLEKQLERLRARVEYEHGDN